MFNWRLHVSGQCYAPNTDYGIPCNPCTDTLGIWVMSVPIMPLHLVHLASSPVTTLPLAGFVITLTHLLVVMDVTASARFWKDCTASESKQRRYLRVGVSAVLIIGFFVSLTHASVSLVVLLSALLPAHPFCSSGEAMESPTSFVSTAWSSGESFAHNTWNPLLELLVHEHIRSSLLLSVDEFDLAKIALSCQFALDLLCCMESVHSSE